MLSPYAFSICDTTGYEPYQYGGIARQVKGSSSLVAFVSTINFSVCVPYVVSMQCLTVSKCSKKELKII